MKQNYLKILRFLESPIEKIRNSVPRKLVQHNDCVFLKANKDFVEEKKNTQSIKGKRNILYRGK